MALLKTPQERQGSIGLASLSNFHRLWASGWGLISGPGMIRMNMMASWGVRVRQENGPGLVTMHLKDSLQPDPFASF
jgi:hypothetical protein